MKILTGPFLALLLSVALSACSDKPTSSVQPIDRGTAESPLNVKDWGPKNTRQSEAAVTARGCSSPVSARLTARSAGEYIAGVRKTSFEIPIRLAISVPGRS
jgi:hypothetical protein